MTKLKKYLSRIATPVLLALVAGAAAFFGARWQPDGDVIPPSDIVALGTTHFTNVSAEDITATDDATIGDDLTVTGDTATGLLTVTQTELTATTTTITPTATFYHLDSAAAVTITLAACSTEGQLLILYGDDNNTITVADSNIRTTTGNALQIGQYDVALFVCDDTEWIELLLAADS